MRKHLSEYSKDNLNFKYAGIQPPTKRLHHLDSTHGFLEIKKLVIYLIANPDGVRPPVIVTGLTAYFFN